MSFRFQPGDDRIQKLFARLLMCGLPVLTALMFGALAGCSNTTRLSGMYVAHPASFVEILQLTESSDGHVEGVLSTVSMNQHGELSSRRMPLSGRTDLGVITLGPLAGTWNRNSIRIQMTTANGSFQSELFERADDATIKRYTQELQTKAQSIIFNEDVSKRMNDMRDTLEKAGHWTEETELHIGRMANVIADNHNSARDN